jgi:hypothetical protein
MKVFAVIPNMGMPGESPMNDMTTENNTIDVISSFDCHRVQSCNSTTNQDIK